MLLIQRFHTYTVATDTGFGTTGGFGTSAFGTTTNTGGLFGSTQNKPGLSFIVCLYSLDVHKPNVWIDEICANNNHLCDIIYGFEYQKSKSRLLLQKMCISFSVSLTENVCQS